MWKGRLDNTSSPVRCELMADILTAPEFSHMDRIRSFAPQLVVTKNGYIVAGHENLLIKALGFSATGLPRRSLQCCLSG